MSLIDKFMDFKAACEASGLEVKAVEVSSLGPLKYEIATLAAQQNSTEIQNIPWAGVKIAGVEFKQKGDK